MEGKASSTDAISIQSSGYDASRDTGQQQQQLSITQQQQEPIGQMPLMWRRRGGPSWFN